MSDELRTYSFQDHFIEKLVDYIKQDYFARDKDLTRLAVVFGGKRPELFVKKELSRRLGKTFFPPVFFSIDEFVDHAFRKTGSYQTIADLDLCYLIYNLAQKFTPAVLKNRANFAAFLPWAQEILGFIEQVDLEDIPASALSNIQINAQTGYVIPKDINLLLESLTILRKKLHQVLDEKKAATRGLKYLKSSENVASIAFDEFDEILFCNFFYMHATERKIIKSLYERKKAKLFFQGNEEEWPVFKKLSADLGTSIRSAPVAEIPLRFYAGFDTHSQVGLVREIVKDIKASDPSGKALSKTVIVLPEPEHVIALVSEISSVIDNFNISMGYPLKRSSFYSLFDFIFMAQLSRKNDLYYARDYLRVLRHPFVKNLELGVSATVMRVLIHKMEEILTGQEKTTLSGSLFFKLTDMINQRDLYELSQTTLQAMGFQIRFEDLKTLITKLHDILFYQWENVKHFRDFADVLEKFLDVFIEHSFLEAYPLNLKIAQRIYAFQEEFKGASFHAEAFSLEELFKIFRRRIENEMVAFHGSPLKGLQILGLFETRSLNFDHVIICDVNEGVLPKLKVYEPLIPREVMIGLGLNRLEEEEEIQRYQFRRLIGGAKEVHLVYEESRDKEKSRFIEELLWEKQKSQQKINVVPVIRPRFQVKVIPKKTIVPKTSAVLEFLRDFRYSASSINTYTRCPLRFYYNYVLGLSEKEDLTDEPENREVGNFIHNLLEEMFKPKVGAPPGVDTAFRSRFLKRLKERFEAEISKTMKSDAFLLKEILDVRLKNFLDREEQAKDLRDVKEVVAIEERFVDQMALAGTMIKFVYKVDRIDRLKDDSLLILDYKTGSNDPMPKSVDRIATINLSRENIKTMVKSFQIPLYFYYFHKRFPENKLNAAFYNLRTLKLDPFIDDKTAWSIDQINEAFLRALDFIMQEILNPAVDFKPDDSDNRYCAVCPYYYACR